MPLKIELTKKAQKKCLAGYPLIQPEDVVQLPKPLPKTWVQFVDAQKQWLATGYLGQQNKGIGWVLAPTPQKLDQHFFEQRLRVAKEARAVYAQDSLTNAYRLVNGEGDWLGGMTVDRYDFAAVFSWYNETLYALKDVIVAAFRVVFPEIQSAVEKIRFTTKNLPETQHLFGKVIVDPLVVQENGISYVTYMNEGLMTGIFLDQKEVRAQLANGLAAGKTVLNLFSYTGAFSVAAAMGGASATTSVDLAKRSIKKTQEQFLCNALALAAQQIVVMDVFEYFKYAKKKALRYDVIILDPPSFARNKKKVFSVAKDYQTLVKEAVTLLSNDGLLIASTNAANLSMAKFTEMVTQALLEKKVRFHVQQTYRLPTDFQVQPQFPEGNYLKVLCIQLDKM